MATGDSVITCDNKELLSVWTLLSSCFGKDSNGHIYLRTEGFDSCGDADAVTCGEVGMTDYEQVLELLRRSIVFNADGKAALAIGQTGFTAGSCP